MSNLSTCVPERFQHPWWWLCLWKLGFARCVPLESVLRRRKWLHYSRPKYLFLYKSNFYYYWKYYLCNYKCKSKVRDYVWVFCVLLYGDARRFNNYLINTTSLLRTSFIIFIVHISFCTISSHIYDLTLSIIYLSLLLGVHLTIMMLCLHFYLFFALRVF